MKYPLLLPWAALALAAAPRARAATEVEAVARPDAGPRTSEIVLTTLNSDFQLATSQTDPTLVRYAAALNYGYYFVHTGYLEATVDLGYSHYSTGTNEATTYGTSADQVQLLVGPTFNFGRRGEAIDEAFFASALVGYAFQNESGGSLNGMPAVNENAYLLEGDFGKRIRIFEFASWSPMVSLSARKNRLGFNAGVTAVPVRVSLLF